MIYLNWSYISVIFPLVLEEAHIRAPYSGEKKKKSSNNQPSQHHEQSGVLQTFQEL